MTELHTNGNYEAYLAQLFNPVAGGAQLNSGALQGVLGAIGNGAGSGFGGIGAAPLPNPWAGQNHPQSNAAWPQQQWPQQQLQNPAQGLAPVQLAQLIAAKQALQAIQYAQAQQALQQLAQNLAAQQWGQPVMGAQPQFGYGGGFGAGPIGQGFGQYGPGTHNPMNQGLQQQALQQLAQSLAGQQWGQPVMGAQPQFGYGGGFGTGPVSQGFAQFHGPGTYNPMNQALQQQALQQLAQYLATQHPAQFRYGLTG